MVRLRQLLSETCLHYSDLAHLCHLIPYLPIPHRKAIMTLCRVQQSPWSNPRVHKAISSSLQYRFVAVIRSRAKEYSFLSDILPTVLEYINDPIILGFLSMFIRVIPLQEDTSARLELEATIEKELGSCLGTDRPMQLDYQCLFAADEESRSRPLVQDSFPRPVLAKRIKQAIDDWKV